MALSPEGGFDQLLAMGLGFQPAKMLMAALGPLPAPGKRPWRAVESPVL